VKRLKGLTKELLKLKGFMKELLSNKYGLAGIVLIAPFIIMAVFAPFLTSYGPYETGGLKEILLPPCKSHILGTDDMGRDVWSQLVYGARISLTVGFLASAIGICIGTTVGLVAGFYGGIVDEILMRIVDVLLIMPFLPFVIVLAAVLGPSMWNIIFLLAVLGWPTDARLVRSQVLSIKERPFFEAAVCIGESDLKLMFFEILPCVLPIVFAETVLWVANAIYSEAVLSFLGLGDPTHISWGMMLNFAFSSGVMAKAWWWVYPPGMSIAFVVLGFTFLGSAINEILSPKYKEV